MNSISQIYKNELKNRIENKFSDLSSEMIDTIIKSLANPITDEKYFDFISDIQNSTREMLKMVIVETLEELDLQFKNSSERLKKYVVNKSKVSRTITTIFGDLSFKRTYYESRLNGDKHFYIDEVFNLPKYDHYDPVIKALAIDKAISTSQAEAGRTIGENINTISNLLSENRVLTHISRQTIHNWINEWNAPDYVYEQVPNTPNSLYIMFDEKFIGCQDLNGDIMVKSMVCFEGVKNTTKGRRKLINRTIHHVYSQSPWDEFITVLSQKYNLSKVKYVYILADGGKWIKTGINELKVEPQIIVKYLLCEFHFKQAINRITTDKDLRKEFLKSFNEDKKKVFKEKVEKIIEENNGNKENKTKNLNYILNNYRHIKAMLKSKIGSSMESHISHYVASTFSSRPKGFSSKKIVQYLKLNNYANNGLNIIKLYALSYNKNKKITINEKELNYKIFDRNKQIPILANGENTGTYNSIKALIY